MCVSVCVCVCVCACDVQMVEVRPFFDAGYMVASCAINGGNVFALLQRHPEVFEQVQCDGAMETGD